MNLVVQLISVRRFPVLPTAITGMAGMSHYTLRVVTKHCATNC
jgi:hypothetical protein